MENWAGNNRLLEGTFMVCWTWIAWWRSAELVGSCETKASSGFSYRCSWNGAVFSRFAELAVKTSCGSICAGWATNLVVSVASNSERTLLACLALFASTFSISIIAGCADHVHSAWSILALVAWGAWGAVCHTNVGEMIITISHYCTITWTI